MGSSVSVTPQMLDPRVGRESSLATGPRGIQRADPGGRVSRPLSRRARSGDGARPRSGAVGAAAARIPAACSTTSSSHWRSQCACNPRRVARSSSASACPSGVSSPSAATRPDAGERLFATSCWSRYVSRAAVNARSRRCGDRRAARPSRGRSSSTGRCQSPTAPPDRRHGLAHPLGVAETERRLGTDDPGVECSRASGPRRPRPPTHRRIGPRRAPGSRRRSRSSRGRWPW